MSDQSIRLGVMTSGVFGERLLPHVSERGHVAFVLSDKNSTGIRGWCEKNKVPFWTGNPRSQFGWRELVQNKPVDILFSLGYLFLVPADIIALPRIAAINFHGSLLPRYRGRTPHVWAIINGEKETGLTAHLMTEECDAGNILLQNNIPIHHAATGGEILQKFMELAPVMIDQIITMAKNNNLQGVEQDHSLATYVGKRTPEDGLIDWSWNTISIYNWIRAQADPYPGAFSFYLGQKVSIHKAALVDRDIDLQASPGEVLRANGKILVRTGDGFLELLDVRSPIEVEFRNGTFFQNRIP